MLELELELTNTLMVLDEYCKEFDRLYKQKLIRDDKKATGNLINSVYTKIEIADDIIEVKLNVADYYYWVENGRNPGKFPPLTKIQKWIKDKPVVPRPIDGKLPTEKQLSFLIGRKIAEKGIKPGNQIKQTQSELNSIYMIRLEAAIEQDFINYQLQLLNEIERIVRI